MLLLLPTPIRFCIAPLDVVKIRLQLQTHSLSDPLSHYGYGGPVYKGTLGTARAILQEEGYTVRGSSVSFAHLLMSIGSMERQCPG